MEDFKLIAVTVVTRTSKHGGWGGGMLGSSGNVKKVGNGGSEGYQQLWQLCGYGKLSHNGRFQNRRNADQINQTSNLYLGLTWQAGPRHHTQQLPNPNFCRDTLKPYSNAQKIVWKTQAPYSLYSYICSLLFLIWSDEKNHTALGRGDIIMSQQWNDLTHYAVRCPNTSHRSACSIIKCYKASRWNHK